MTIPKGILKVLFVKTHHRGVLKTGFIQRLQSSQPPDFSAVASEPSLADLQHTPLFVFTGSVNCRSTILQIGIGHLSTSFYIMELTHKKFCSITLRQSIHRDVLTRYIL